MRPRRQRVVSRGRALAGLMPSRSALWTCCAALGLGLGAGLADRPPSLLGSVEHMAVSGAARIPPGELAAAAAMAPGTAFAAFDRKAVATRVARHPWVASARVIALPPEQLLLAVVEREPKAIAWLGVPARAWHVDAEGAPFAAVDATELDAMAQIHGVAELAPNQPHAELAGAVRILEAVEAQALPRPLDLWLSDEDPRAVPSLRLELGGRPARIVLGEGPLEPKLERLARLLAANRPETAEAEVIDVRFEGQVILRSGPPSEGGGATDERGGVSPS